LSLLRRLLPLGVGSSACEARSTELLRWLETLPGVDAADAARLIAARIGEVRAAGVDPRTRLTLLDSLREAAESRLPALERTLAAATLPLAEDARRAWAGAAQLLDALAGGYAEVASAAASRWSLRGGSRPIRPPLIQAMRYCARRLALRYRVHAGGNDPGWLDLHRLYGLAREAGFAATLLGGDEIPEAIYLKALLLSFAEPTRFAAGELDLVQGYLDRTAHLAEIVPAEQASRVDADPACFLIQVAQPHGGLSLRKWKPERIAPGDLAIRCGQLLARLDGQIAGLEQRVAPPMLGLPKLAADPRYLGLMRSLRECWGAPATRRHKRMRAFPRSELVAGFDAVWERRSARPAAEAGLPASARTESSEWAIHNESPQGYALGYLRGDTRPVRVGELVAMHPSHQTDDLLCIVRRLVNRWQDGLEVGVQVLGARMVAATVSVRTGEAQPQERTQRILVLPAMPAHGDSSGILAPVGALATGTRFSAHNCGEPTVLKVGRRIERLASCELFALEQVAI